MPLDFELSEEHVLVQDAMLKCLQPFQGRRAELRHTILVEKKFPQDLWDAICSTGLMGAVIPEEYGGNGMGLLACAIGLEALAKKGFGNALLILTAMDAACILRNGTEEMKRRYLPKIATGELKFCFAITEPNAGSNAFRLETLATKDDEGNYLISGEKCFITGADVADKMLLVCRTTPRSVIDEKGLPKAFGLALFILDTKAEGISLSPIPTRGIEGMTQFMVYLDNVKVSSKDLVGQHDMGAMALFQSLNPERILAAASACGIASHCLDIAVDYAKKRTVFKNRPIGEYQGISHPLAKVKIELEASKLLTYRAAWAFDQGMHPGKVGSFANAAKYSASEMVINAVDRAIQTLGGYGFSEEYGIIYYYETVRLLRTAPVTSEMILNFVAEHDLGLPRSY
jgi:alkylation response protein AidB-like acyl-CoA dehydrogenase